MTDIQNLSLVEPQDKKWVKPVADALREYRDVFFSGLAVAVVLTLFRFLSGETLSLVTKFEHELTKHALQFPMLLLDIALFVAGLSVALSVPWGPVLRRHVIKPVLHFLLHNFGVAGGVIFFIWATDSASWTVATGPKNLMLVVFFEALLLLLGFLLALGAHICKHGISDFLSGNEQRYVSPRMRKLAHFVPLPAGGYIMWLAYQDILRLAAQVTIGH